MKKKITLTEQSHFCSPLILLLTFLLVLSTELKFALFTLSAHCEGLRLVKLRCLSRKCPSKYSCHPKLYFPDIHEFNTVNRSKCKILLTGFFLT